MDTITQTTIDEQKANFKKLLDNILSNPYGTSIEIDDNGLISKAKINTTEIIDKSQMSLIIEVADAYNLDFQQSRSGAGIKIQFKLITPEDD